MKIQYAIALTTLASAWLVAPAALGQTAQGSRTPANPSDSLSFMVSRFDFKSSHPDFEQKERGSKANRGIVTGAVQDTLGDDGLPVWSERKKTYSSKANFDQWYRTVEGVNMLEVTHKLLDPTPGDATLYKYTNENYWPIDGRLLGNEDGKFKDSKGTAHNFHFTTHLSGHFSFDNESDEFKFTGDDDVWAFFDGKLMIDLGGVHAAATATITGKDLIGKGFEMGKEYNLDVFHAERQTKGSNFSIETHFDIRARHTSTNIDWLTKKDKPLEEVAPKVTHGPVTVGITWSNDGCAAGSDLDLWAILNGEEDRWLNYDETNTKDGHHHGDVLTGAAKAETIGFHSVKKLSDLGLAIHHYGGACSADIKGVLRAHFNGKIYESKFTLPAGNGSGGTSERPKSPQSDASWVKIDATKLFKL